MIAVSFFTQKKERCLNARALTPFNLVAEDDVTQPSVVILWTIPPDIDHFCPSYFPAVCFCVVRFLVGSASGTGWDI